MEDLEIIKKYGEIKSLNEVCKRANYNRSNIVTGRAPDKKIRQVALMCKVEILKAYNSIILGVNENESTETDTL